MIKDRKSKLFTETDPSRLEIHARGLMKVLEVDVDDFGKSNYLTSCKLIIEMILPQANLQESPKDGALYNEGVNRLSQSCNNTPRNNIEFKNMILFL